MQVGKGSAMKHYNAPCIQLPHARPTMHCIPLVLFILVNTLIFLSGCNYVGVTNFDPPNVNVKHILNSN